MSKCNYNETFRSETHRRSHTISFILFTLIFCLLSFAESIATIRYVSKTGNSTPPYITWETAADSIQECINVCVFGDTIYVANGVYEEQVVMIPGLALIGAGTDSCLIDSRQLVTMQNYKTIDMKNSCLIQGFYILSSNDFDYGSGILGEGQIGLITENKFSNANTGIDLYNANIRVYKNNFFNLRFGIAVSNSNSIVRRNEIFTLTDLGSGIFIDAFNNNYVPTIDSNYIGTKVQGIRKSFGTRPIIKNNVIEFLQYGGEAIYLSSSDSAKVLNNLIFITDQTYGAYGIHNQSTQYLQANNNFFTGKYLRIFFIGPDNTVKNNVVSNAEGEIRAWGNQNLQYQYNDVWNSDVSYTGFTLDTTNLSVSPMIVNDDSTQADLDFHLQMYSPLIDAGDPNIIDKDSSRSDIGLYGGPYGESYIYVDLPPRPPVNLTVNVDTLIKLRWNKNTEADFNHYNLYRDTVNNFTVDSTKLIASIIDTFYTYIIPTGVESLYFKLTGIDNQGNESNPSEEVGVLVTLVNDEWKALNNYILYQNYPNPFNPSTKIGYKLKERGYVKLYVYDIKGELVSVLVNEVQEAGYYDVEFSASNNQHPESSIKNLASGVYIYQIFVKGENNPSKPGPSGIPVFSDIKKMLLVK